ncbi:hypothetical protein G3N57_10935 [Paraburkholderia sp. Se-20369]|nr:hypothetical protein [Paraburkholderia sp. Se-20369]
MTIYYSVVEGDPLDGGGQVSEGAHDSWIDGRRQAYLGHRAFCERCKTFGKIIAGVFPETVERMYDAAANTFEALGGDRVMCKCDAMPRVMAVYGRNSMLIDTGGASSDEACMVNGAASASNAVYDQQFVVRDRTTGLPLSGEQYWIVNCHGDVLATGTTDARGRTSRVITLRPESVKLEIREEAE